jgi:hypothetical protein
MEETETEEENGNTILGVFPNLITQNRFKESVAVC